MQSVSVGDVPTVSEYIELEAETYFKCSKIKCVHQRPLDTGDYTEDF
jgi:hypothetical protein